MYPMHHKYEVIVFLKWKKIIEVQSDRKIKRLTLDNDKEYKLDLFLNLFRLRAFFDTYQLDKHHNRVE